MTKEEKAKAYDEALERAKEIKSKILYSHLSTESCKAVSEYIDTIIPELAESEGERIRKELLGYHKLMAEKFTEDENCRHPVWIAYLKKQKENPKTADSISLDCASCAKSEDRSPKHSDSYGTDIRDTPAYWRGWDDAMKQKEQKPYEPKNWPADKDALTQEQKPTEWSDTDNIGWDEAFACVTRAEKSAKNEEELQNAVTAEKWLKEIKFKYYVHPVKQEWSEKDEEMLNNIIEHLKVAYCACSWLPETLIWLKSLKKRFSYQTK